MEVPMMALPDLRTVEVPSGIPPGLAYLAVLNEVNIHQLPDVSPGCNKSNRYMLCNSSDEQFMSATEDSNCISRLFCGSSRNFGMNFIDNSGQTLIQVYRPLRCTGCLPCCCCLQTLYIMSPPGYELAHVHQVWTAWQPKYVVESRDDMMFTIVGQPGLCGADRVFKATDIDGLDVGRISKRRETVHDLFGSPSNFKVEFTGDIDILHKTVLLAATFLIDFVNLECCN